MRINKYFYTFFIITIFIISCESKTKEESKEHKLILDWISSHSNELICEDYNFTEIGKMDTLYHFSKEEDDLYNELNFNEESLKYLTQKEVKDSFEIERLSSRIDSLKTEFNNVTKKQLAGFIIETKGVCHHSNRSVLFKFGVQLELIEVLLLDENQVDWKQIFIK